MNFFNNQIILVEIGDLNRFKSNQIMICASVPEHSGMLSAVKHKQADTSVLKLVRLASQPLQWEELVEWWKRRGGVVNHDKKAGPSPAKSKQT